MCWLTYCFYPCSIAAVSSVLTPSSPLVHYLWPIPMNGNFKFWTFISVKHADTIARAIASTATRTILNYWQPKVTGRRWSGLYPRQMKKVIYSLWQSESIIHLSDEFTGEWVLWGRRAMFKAFWHSFLSWRIPYRDTMSIELVSQQKPDKSAVSKASELHNLNLSASGHSVRIRTI